MSMSSEDRFTDLAWIQGDFQKSTISPSQTTLPDYIYFIKYQLATYLKFKKELPSVSFLSGTQVHNYFQHILIGKFKIEDVEKHFTDIVNKIIFPDKDQAKIGYIKKDIKKYVQHHLDAIKEVSNNKMDGWEVEVEGNKWYDEMWAKEKLNIANVYKIDCVNNDLKIYTEHKNMFGGAYLSKAKKNEGKNIYNYRKPNTINSPRFTWLIQTAIYGKHFNYEYEPHIIAVHNEGYYLFNKENCPELTKEGLKYYFNKFLKINIKRQKMLRLANGSMKELACIIGIDWSDIRNHKDNIMLSNIEDEDIKKVEAFYDDM